MGEIPSPFFPLHDPDAIGETLREARVQQGLSQRALARKTGISQGSISAIEKGLMDPSVRTLWLLAGALGILLGGLLLLSQPKREGGS